LPKHRTNEPAETVPPRSPRRAMEEPTVMPSGPTITAALDDGPLQGTRIEAAVVEGRPPSTLDVPAEDGGTCRYCLADWMQSGASATYTFLYRV
jgi:hypothetical protein